MSLFCPRQPLELRRGGLEIATGHDVVALEDGARLVPTQLHGHAFGDTAAYHVSDGRSSQVVWDTAGTTRGIASALPGLAKSLDRLRLSLPASLVCDHPKEHPGLDLAEFPQAHMLGVLCLKLGVIRSGGRISYAA